MFGEQFAVVTSANLTRSALGSNIEVGVELTGSAGGELAEWFDAFWTTKAKPLDLTQVSEWQQQTDALRRQFTELWKKAGALLTLPNEALPAGESREDLRILLDGANQFFCCDTNRRQGARTPKDGWELEERMHNRGYAAAWESFTYPSHMDKVEHGDAIFMFAKGVGIIGIGRAKAKRQVLEPRDPDRIGGNFENTREWRVPVDWLDWREKNACEYKGLNRTFWDVTKNAHMREAVGRHFLP